MVEARIEHVTVYARGARVRRVMTITSPNAKGSARIGNLPVAVIDDTVRVEVVGPAIATAVSTGVAAPPAEEAAAEESEEIRAARLRVALASSEIERLRAALDGASSTQVVAEDPTDDGPAAWSAVVAARRALVAMKAQRVHALHESLRAANHEYEDANRALTAALDRDRRAGTAKAAKLHELRKYVDVELAPPAGSALADDGTDASGEITIRLEYLVAAARWTPSYVARLDGANAKFEIRASVAQATGEDWVGVPLALSTAEATRFAALPELLPQRIGRKQDEPKKSGFRAPPTGAAELYADYQRETSQQPGRRRGLDDTRAATPATTIANEIWDQPVGGMPLQAELEGGIADLKKQVAEKSLRRARSEAAPAAPPPPPMQAQQAFAAPVMPSAMPAPGGRPLAKAAMRSGGGGAPRDEEKERGGKADVADHDGEPQAHAFGDESPARLDYANLRMAPPASASRGQLIAAPPDPYANQIANEVGAASSRIAGLPLPAGCHASWSHTFDYAFATDGAVDVKADGAWHSIAVTSKAGAAKVSHVAVPREQADVFRVAAIANPFTGPLLPGPIDVYDRGRFLVTSSVDYTPPAGTVDIGLGVDPAVKIARNTEYREEAAGMLRGALRLFHTIAIDVENLTGRSIDLEVRERVPVSRDGDDDVEVTLGRSEPAWEKWTPDPEAPAHARLRGGHRWRLALPAGQKQKLKVAYEVKIASKHELVGGNRREL